MIKINKKSVTNYLKVAKLELIIIAAAIFIDLLSKYLVGTFLELDNSRPKELIPDFLYFYHIGNPFAAFGLFEKLENAIGENGLRWFFIIFIIIATSVFFVFLVTGQKNNRLYRISLALIVGGAIGNLYDRIVHGVVRDFIEVRYFGKTLFGSKSFPVFNIADSCLVIGVILFFVYVIFFFYKDEKRREEEKKEKEKKSNYDKTDASDSKTIDDETTVYAQVGPFAGQNKRK